MSSPSSSIVLPDKISSCTIVVAFSVSPRLSTVSPGRSFSFSESLIVNVRSSLVNISPYVFAFFSALTTILRALLLSSIASLCNCSISWISISSVAFAETTSDLFTVFTGTHIVTLLYFLLSAG